jgi:tetratricopeptide (TPR) repeat protein
MMSLDRELGNAGLSGLENFCASRGWRPVFLDDNAAIFVRLSTESADLVNRLQLDCEKVKFDHPPLAGGYRGKAEQLSYYLNASGILIVLDRNQEALTTLQHAQLIFSENAFLHYAKGVALQNMGRWNEAEPELRNGIKLGSEDAASALARQYDQQARYAEEAKVLADAAERASQPCWFYVKLGNAKLAMGEPRQALVAFERADKENPFAPTDEFGALLRNEIAEGRRRAEQQLKAGGR